MNFNYLMNPILAFIVKYKFVILFYLLVIAFFYVKRNKLDFQAKIIVLYRMKWGLKLMDKISTRFREWIILLGYIGVGTGFVGLVVISYILVKNIFVMAIQPETTSSVSLVLPGVNIPGLGVLPFWYWLIAIFLIAVIHEFSHGIVARAHDIEVKNTGIVLFGPVLGAFVEPNEKKLRKASDINQYSVLAAGSFSNILLAVFALILLKFAFLPIQQTMVDSNGFTFDEYVDDNLPFAKAGIVPGTIINGIDDVKINNFQEFNEELIYHKPGDKIKVITPDKDYPIVLASNPDFPKRGYLGIRQIRNDVVVKENYQHGIGKVVFYTLEWFNGLTNGGKGFLFWLYLLSFGIGLFNLLPLPIVDGGRMAQVFLHKLKGFVKGEKRYHQISLFFLLVLLLNLFYPLLTKLF
jgi:membrane-associated protease RseP (regulator of RpoE activity)